ncbi:Ell1-associated factor 1 [Psilocybe cubensis]|uniref:Ell1-associated factor 1 n=1 Tax=Psilocybe cubensis TaxID=181762 RepID=A0ACB8H5I0_PSICU|nr:Ell1-associated factor 1 [Psilocybe cubensis]KAH9483099.1 Ell1-associated factor 1 [Psilocybe cubensis]
MATTEPEKIWTEKNSRHSVNIGSSLGRALKNRKNKDSPAPAKKSALPERDFFSFKFNFKPKDVDLTQPATLDIRQGAETTQVKVEYPSTTNPEIAHPFSGTEIPAKEVDCILMYDTETGTYTLEKMDSFVTYTYEGKPVASRRTASPSPGASIPSSSTSAANTKQDDYKMTLEDFGMEEGEFEEYDGTKPIPISYIEPVKEEEEEEEGEEIEIPLHQARIQKPPPPTVTRPVKALPKPRAKSKSPPLSKSQSSMPPPPVPASALASASASSHPAPSIKTKPAPAKTKKGKAPAPVPAPVPKPTPPAPMPLASYPSEEIIEIVRPIKKQKTSTPQQPPPTPAPPVRSGIALPDGNSGFVTLPSAPPAPPPPAPVQEAESSDEEEDWEPVPTATPTIPQASMSSFSHHTLDLEDQLEDEIFGDGFGDEEGEGDGDDSEIDPDDFARQMEEEEDFLGAAMSPAPSEQTRRPISLNELAGGVPLGDSDDDFSSSDDSEDD